MEHLVGIKVKDALFGDVGFLTWGRVLHRVDPDSLLDAVRMHLTKFGIRNPESIELCDTLQEVAHFPYFFEGLFEFSQKIIPDGKDYKPWQNTMKKAIEKGEEIYFLGVSKDQKERNANLRGTISHGFWYAI